MFKNTFQSGFLSILYSIGSKPLQIWDSQGEGIPTCPAPLHSVPSPVCNRLKATKQSLPSYCAVEVLASFCVLKDVCQLVLNTGGFCSAQWPHQEDHGPRHQVHRAGNHQHQHHHHLHHVPSRPPQDPGDQAALPGHDPEEHEEVLQLRGAGAGRQECPTAIPGVKLPGMWTPFLFVWPHCLQIRLT